MLGEGLHKERRPEPAARIDPTRGWSLVGLSVATSIDALGAGFGFGLFRADLFRACMAIGLTALGMTWTGIRLGKVLGGRIGPFAEVLGGAVLILLGVRMIVF
jgi:putative Mn2+ efflux pump MntP